MKPRQLSGGSTNTVLLWGHRIIRIHSDASNKLLDDRQYQKAINNALSQTLDNITPRVHCFSQEYTVEQYIPNAKPFHPNSRQQMLTLVDKLIIFHKIRPVGVPVEPILEKRLEKWAQLSNVKVVPKVCPTSNNIVFCHNDLTCDNILTTGEKKIHLIDYEYAGYNYLEWELANFFSEIKATDDFKTNFCREYSLRSGITVTVDAVDRFVKSVHLLWYYWALVMDYIPHAEYRYGKL